MSKSLPSHPIKGNTMNPQMQITKAEFKDAKGNTITFKVSTEIGNTLSAATAIYAELENLVKVPGDWREVYVKAETSTQTAPPQFAPLNPQAPQEHQAPPKKQSIWAKLDKVFERD